MRRARANLAALLALVAASSCGAREAAPAPEVPGGDALPAWTTQLDRDHPLVGKIWDVAGQRFVAESALQDAFGSARLAVLGEKHDNADHHVLQARLIERAVARGRRPALVFEMLDSGNQAALDRARTEHPRDVDAIAAAVDWEHSGWPAFALYRPLFAVAVGAGLPIAAAGLPRGEAMRIAREGTAALEPELVSRYGLSAPLPEPEEKALQAEMRDAHCGLMPDAMLGNMALVQRARDARLAEQLYAQAQPEGGAVPIAGNGHARNDRGVPAQLAHAREAKAFSLGLLEVQPAWRNPSEYAAMFAAQALPFDYVWFTPRATDEDPCAELRRTHGKH